MSDDIVFKFVSLRAPVEQLPSEKVIEPGDRAQDFEEALEKQKDSDLKVRLKNAAEELWKESQKSFGQASIQSLYITGTSHKLLNSNYRDFTEFRGTISSELNRAGLKAGDPSLLRALWSGYLASLFGVNKVGAITRFFHEWIHLLHLVEIGQHAPLLPLKRLALPVSLSQLIIANKSLSNQRSPITVNRPPPSSVGGSEDQVAAATAARDFSRLERLCYELKNLAFANRSAISVSGGGVTVTPPPQRNGQQKSSAEIAVPRTSVRRIQDLNTFKLSSLSAESQQVMNEFKLTDQFGIDRVLSQVELFQTQLYTQAARASLKPVLGYVGGTFIRLKKTQ